MTLRSNHDREYLTWIRSLPCCVCGRKAPSCAHHHTGRRGMSQKSNDRKVMPVCHLCHMAFHSASGWARDMKKAERRAWQDRMVTKYQRLWMRAKES